MVGISPPATDERSSSSSSSSETIPFDGIANFLSSSSVIEPFERRCSLLRSSFDYEEEKKSYKNKIMKNIRFTRDDGRIISSSTTSTTGVALNSSNK